MSGEATVVVAPLHEELAALRGRLGESRRLRLGLPGLWTGSLGGSPVVLAVTGDGPRQAREGIDRLLGALPIGRLLVIGAAGALTDDLGLGRLLVADTVCDERGATFTPDRALLRAAIELAGARPACLMSADRLADTPIERQRLLAAMGACGSAAVDTESAALVTRAAQVGLPWIVLRAVSDTADESLPALLNRCRDEGGGIRRWRVARGLLRRPAALPALLALRARIERCSEVLAAAVVRLARCPAPISGGGPGGLIHEEAPC